MASLVVQRQCRERTRCGTGPEEHPPLVAREGERGREKEAARKTERKLVAWGSGAVLGEKGTSRVGWGQSPDRALRRSMGVRSWNRTC